METTKSKTRKVVKVGGSLIVTLPREFTRKVGLRKGDLVGVTYDSILVVVVPRLAKEEKDGMAD